MAATGFTPVYIYASGTTGNIPSASNLTNTTNGSEIALNYFDGKLFYKNASNSVVTVPLLQSSSSQNGWLSSTDWSTFNGKQAALVSGSNIKTVSGVSLLGSGDVGTIGTGYGGTGLTSFTANGVVYASSTSALATSSQLTFNATNTFEFSTTNQYPLMSVASSAANAILGYRINNTGTSGRDWRVEQGRSAVGEFNITDSSASNAVRITVNATGQVGISRSPSYLLDVNGTARFNTTIGVGNTAPAGSGSGITFPATQSSSSDANTLDDYEEGYWTPNIYGATTAGTNTYYRQYGGYVKIGRMVYVQAWVQINVKDASMAGTARIGGLPFTVSNIAGDEAAAFSVGQWALPANWTSVNCYTIGGQTYIQPNAISAATTSNYNPLQATDIGNGTSFEFCFCYVTAT